MSATPEDYTVELDRTAGVGQHGESFVLTRPGGDPERIELHDYARVYAVPGLYEEVVQHQLACASPQTLAERLATAAAAEQGGEDALRALDVGAGNGVVGEELRARGILTPVGSDSVAEAGEAAKRDRPGLYELFLVDDGSDEALERLLAAVSEHGLNTLSCAGALGRGHIPFERLARVWRAFPAGSWLGLTASRDDVDSQWGGAEGALSALSGDDPHPTRLVDVAPFRHRLLMDGGEVGYYVIVGRKTTDGA